jgi:uncharacterized membrane protein
MADTPIQATAEAAAPFRIGQVFRQTFHTLSGNMMPFGLIALVFSAIEGFLDRIMLAAPIFGVEALGGANDPDLAAGFSVAVGGSMFATVFVPMLLYALLTAILVYGTVSSLRGRPAGLGDCISNGLRYSGPVILVSLVIGLLVTVGTLLLIVPGLIMMVIWWVAVPVAVVEEEGIGGSMRRSAALTSGNRWRVFGLILILIVISVVLFVPLQFLGAVLGFYALLILAWVVNAFIMMVSAVTSGVAYYHLRVAKEGADINQIAAVFD